MVAMVLGIICNYQFSSVLFWLLEVNEETLSDKWLSGMKPLLVGSTLFMGGIIMGVGMWIAKEWIYPIIEKQFRW